MVLSSEPTADVLLSITSNNVYEGTFEPNRLVFTSGNWSQLQPVIVTGMDDRFYDSDIGYSIENTMLTTADPLYGAIDPNGVSVTSIDDEIGCLSDELILTADNFPPDVILDCAASDWLQVDPDSEIIGIMQRLRSRLLCIGLLGCYGLETVVYLTL